MLLVKQMPNTEQPNCKENKKPFIKDVDRRKNTAAEGSNCCCWIWKIVENGRVNHGFKTAVNDEIKADRDSDC